MMKNNPALKLGFVSCLLIIFSLISTDFFSPQFATAKGKSSAKSKSKKKKLSREQKRIKRLEDYLVTNYTKHLKKNKDWLARCFLVSALGKVNCSKSTSALIRILKKEKNPAVVIHAWEAIHARADTISKSHHNQWVNAGAKAFKRFKGKCFTGNLRVGLLKARAGYGPKADIVIKLDFLFFKMLDNIDHKNSVDYGTLVAMREIVANLRDKKLIKKLAAKIGDPKYFNKIEYILSGLDESYQPVGNISRKASKKQIMEARKYWLKWIRTADLKDPKKIDYKLYRETSEYFPKPITITNLKKDRRHFKGDLEMKKIRVNSFELSFVIDSTGSMSNVMKWVANDVEKILAAMTLVAKEPKLGVTYFRHEIDPKAQTSNCCQNKPLIVNGKDVSGNATNNGMQNYYSVKVYTMVGAKGIKALTKCLKQEQAGGGHNGGAAYGGILAAYKYNKWRKRGKKLMIVIGDTPMTKKDGGQNKGPGNTDSIEPCKELVTKMKKENFELHFIRCIGGRTLENEYGALAKISGGKNILATFPRTRITRPLAPGQQQPSEPAPQIAVAHKNMGAYPQIVQAIFESVIPKKHHSKIPSVATIITEYASGLK